MAEFTQKIGRLNELLQKHSLDGLLLQRVSSFAWATCGAASFVNRAVSSGEATLLITREGRHLFTNNIEAPRMEQEEQLKLQGWEFHVHPWHQDGQDLEALTRGLRLGADVPYPEAKDLSQELALLRSCLTLEESRRFRKLGRLCARAMNRAARAVRPGQSEYEIAARLARECERQGVQALVTLIATDERIFKFRHPLPTAKKLEKYAMLVLCGRQAGLVCSITRLVHFGPLPAELRRKAEATARVDAALIAGSRPERSLGEILQDGIKMYAETGFAEEWQLHHQGGLAGYEPREILARPGENTLAAPRMAFAWNPSITGTKSEDTVLLEPSGPRVLTEIDHWPTLSVEIDGQEYRRPAILEIT